MGFKYEDDEGNEEVKPAPRDQRPKRDEHEEVEHEHEPSNNTKESEQNKLELIKEVSRDKEREVNSTSRLYGIEDYARLVHLENNWQRDQFELKNKVSHRITVSLTNSYSARSQVARSSP